MSGTEPHSPAKISHSAEIPAKIGPYEVLAELGAGAHARVFRVAGEDGRELALKLLREAPAAGSAAARRFDRELEAYARIEHEGLLALVDEGTDGAGRRFLVTPLVSGTTLRALVGGNARGLGPEVVELLVPPLCEALAALHAAGFTHRDLKPDNVMLGRDGRVVLLDFGLALHHDHSRLTDDDVVVGSVPYMSPEQIEGGDVGPPSDIWSLGVLAYELCSGERPFARERQSEEVAAILRGVPTPLEQADARVGQALSGFVARCLTREARERPADGSIAREMAQSFDSAALDASARRVALARLCKNPRVERERFDSARVRSLCARARKLIDTDEAFAALDALDRALAYDPQNAEALALVDRAASAGASRTDVPRTTAPRPAISPRTTAPRPAISPRTTAPRPAISPRGAASAPVTNGAVPSARDSESLARSPGVDGDARHGRKRRLALAAAVLALFGIVGTALALWRPWVDQRAQKDAEWRALLGGSTAAPPAARAGATAGVTQHSAATSGSGSAAGVSPIPKIPRLRAIADARMRDDDTPLAAVQKRAAGDPLVERKIFGGASPAALRDSLERRLDKTPGDRDLAARYAIALVASGAEKRGLARLAQLDREGGAAAASFVGYIALRRGDRAAAEKALLRAVSRAPKSVEARRNLGIVRRRMGKTRSAYHDLVAALRLDPSDRQALPELFRIYAHVGLAQRGRPLVERLLRIAPSRADGWAELAVLLADDPAADAQDGLRAARRAVALDPSEAHVQRALCIAAARAGVPRRAACAHAARFLSEDKRVAKLLASAEPASASSGSGSGSSSPTTTAPRTTDSDSAAPSGLRAVRPIKPSTLSNSDPPDKRYDQRARAGKLVPSHLLPNGPAAALRTIDARIKASPGDARFQVSRALILTALGRLKEANSLFAKLRREQPQLVDLWSMLGYLAMRRGKRHEAERLLTRAVKLDATRVDVLRNRAIVRRRLGRTRDAYTDLMGALRLRPADAEGLTELAAIYYKLDRVAEAAALLRRVAELKPFRAKVWIDLAVAEPDPKRAVRAARRAVALAPRSARAVRQLCRQLSEHGAGADGRWLEPIRICTRAAALAPGEPSVMMHRGLAHYHGRRLRAALADIDRAVHARPKHAQYRVNRAIVRQLAGDARGARQDLRAACRYGHAGACNKVKAHAH